MDDIKKAYYDDLKEKSAIARSARLGGRRHGTRKYTKKEIEQMNGPTYSVNLNKFLPYTEFKKLPDALKKEYLEHLIDTWHIGTTAIAKMWGITAGTSCPMMKRLGVKSKPVHASLEDTKRFFTEFVKSEIPVSSAQTKKMTFCNASLSFIGIYDEQSILQRFKSVIPNYMPVKITITVEAAD